MTLDELKARLTGGDCQCEECRAKRGDLALFDHDIAAELLKDYGASYREPVDFDVADIVELKPNFGAEAKQWSEVGLVIAWLDESERKWRTSADAGSPWARYDMLLLMVTGDDKKPLLYAAQSALYRKYVPGRHAAERAQRSAVEPTLTTVDGSA